jgi:hypothetical protein
VSESQVYVPLSVRLRFGHAAVQQLADEIGVDLLHIKGVAVDASLRPAEPHGTDVDVLVRPDHVARLDQAIRSHGWRLYTTFASGSPFGHAQTYTHHAWGFLDVHRYFPGIRVDPGTAFDRLWTDGSTLQIAGVGCRVPSVLAQSVLLILNSARAGASRSDDLAVVWNAAPDDRRAQIMALVDELDANVACAAAIGGLEHYRHERDYRLWKVVSEGGPRSAEWWARVRAAPNLAEAVRIAGRAGLVNVDHLTHRLGRRPTGVEIAFEFLDRPARAVGEAWRGLLGRGAAR